MYTLGRSPVVGHEDEDAVVQHVFPPQRGHDLSNALVELAHHGGVNSSLGIPDVAELGDLVVGSLQGFPVVTAVGRQVGKVHEHGPGLGTMLVDESHGLVGEEVGRVLAVGVPGDAHVAPHVEAQEALGLDGRGDLVGVVVLESVPVAEVRVEAAVGRRVLATVETLVPFADGVGGVAGFLEVLET